MEKIMRAPLSESLIARLLPDAKYSVQELEQKFPPRALAENAMVTRFAPSPTGFMHIGGLYQMLINYKLAKQSGGVFMLRIEDTDTKREIDGAIELIMGTQFWSGLLADETPFLDDTTGKKKWKDQGNYGPYMQSKRKDIYHSVVAELLRTGRAYPCFLSVADMEKIREEQKSSGIPTGIYGAFARDRNLTESQIEEKLKTETPTIRLYSVGDKSQKIFCKDAVRGSIAFPQNDEDIVLIKSNDGLPTYHFAHLCDDHFMRTTHVVRGEEWLPSFPLHIQLFQMMEWTPPVYIHTSTIDKIDAETGKQRKISKRHDPEANVDFFAKEGYPSEAILDYLLNIISSSYESERAKNPLLNWGQHPINIKKIPTSGALFDWKKLEWWAREDIARYSAEDIYNMMDEWNFGGITPANANQCGGIGYSRTITNHFLMKNKDYLIKIFSIERENIDNPKRIRKDFITWKQTLDEVSYFFDENFTGGETRLPVLEEFLSTFDINDDKDTWWNKIVKIAADLGLKNGDVAMALRVALTGRANTPDLYSIMQVMGKDRVIKRIKNDTAKN
jgi:glutamyl-tRNA synthetase